MHESPLFVATGGGHEGVVWTLLAGFCDITTVHWPRLGLVEERVDADLKVMFRKHFNWHLFFVFVMARHPRLGSMLTGAGGVFHNRTHCWQLAAMALTHLDVVQTVLSQGLVPFQ
jgi:hypothetical protein